MPVSEFTEISEPVYIRAQVVFESASGLAKDRVVNTYHYVCDAGTGYLANIKSELQAFYNTIAVVMSSELNRSGVTVRFYDLENPEPSPPVDVQTFTTLASKSGTYLDLPRELAICMSYQAVPYAGVPQRRRRGRIYLGPFAVPSSPGDMDRPATTNLRTTIQGAAQTLIDASQAATDHTWAVYSPTTAGGWALPGASGPPNFPPSVAPVANGWLDDAWDIQRRRGYAPTSRLTFA